MLLRYQSVLVLFSFTILLSCSNYSKTEKSNNGEYTHSLIDDFSDKNALSKWETNDDNSWEITEGDGVGELSLLKAGEFGKIRKPAAYAIIKGLDITNFQFTIDVKCEVDTAISGRDLVLFWNYKDSLHFYYVHVSNHLHKYHNIIGIVDGKERRPISNTMGHQEKARLTDFNWHKVRVKRNIETGSIKVYVDDMDVPIHSLIDSTLLSGSVGVGSFDDYGRFRNLELLYDKK